MERMSAVFHANSADNRKYPSEGERGEGREVGGRERGGEGGRREREGREREKFSES